MWTDGKGFFYGGERQSGTDDREATSEEAVAYRASIAPAPAPDPAVKANFRALIRGRADELAKGTTDEKLRALDLRLSLLEED